MVMVKRGRGSAVSRSSTSASSSSSKSSSNSGGSSSSSSGNKKPVKVSSISFNPDSASTNPNSPNFNPGQGAKNVIIDGKSATVLGKGGSVNIGNTEDVVIKDSRGISTASDVKFIGKTESGVSVLTSSGTSPYTATNYSGVSVDKYGQPMTSTGDKYAGSFEETAYISSPEYQQALEESKRKATPTYTRKFAYNEGFSYGTDREGKPINYFGESATSKYYQIAKNNPGDLASLQSAVVPLRERYLRSRGTGGWDNLNTPEARRRLASKPGYDSSGNRIISRERADLDVSGSVYWEKYNNIMAKPNYIQAEINAKDLDIINRGRVEKGLDPLGTGKAPRGHLPGFVYDNQVREEQYSNWLKSVATNRQNQTDAWKSMGVYDSQDKQTVKSLDVTSPATTLTTTTTLNPAVTTTKKTALASTGMFNLMLPLVNSKDIQSNEPIDYSKLNPFSYLDIPKSRELAKESREKMLSGSPGKMVEGVFQSLGLYGTVPYEAVNNAFFPKETKNEIARFISPITEPLVNLAYNPKYSKYVTDKYGITKSQFESLEPTSKVLLDERSSFLHDKGTLYRQSLKQVYGQEEKKLKGKAFEVDQLFQRAIDSQTGVMILNPQQTYTSVVDASGKTYSTVPELSARQKQARTDFSEGLKGLEAEKQYRLDESRIAYGQGEAIRLMSDVWLSSTGGAGTGLAVAGVPGGIAGGTLGAGFGILTYFGAKKLGKESDKIIPGSGDYVRGGTEFVGLVGSQVATGYITAGAKVTVQGLKVLNTNPSQTPVGTNFARYSPSKNIDFVFANEPSIGAKGFFGRVGSNTFAITNRGVTSSVTKMVEPLKLPAGTGFNSNLPAVYPQTKLETMMYGKAFDKAMKLGGTNALANVRKDVVMSSLESGFGITSKFKEKVDFSMLTRVPEEYKPAVTRGIDRILKDGGLLNPTYVKGSSLMKSTASPDAYVRPAKDLDAIVPNIDRANQILIEEFKKDNLVGYKLDKGHLQIADPDTGEFKKFTDFKTLNDVDIQDGQLITAQRLGYDLSGKGQMTKYETVTGVKFYGQSFKNQAVSKKTLLGGYISTPDGKIDIGGDSFRIEKDAMDVFETIIPTEIKSGSNVQAQALSRQLMLQKKNNLYPYTKEVIPTPKLKTGGKPNDISVGDIRNQMPPRQKQKINFNDYIGTEKGRKNIEDFYNPNKKLKYNNRYFNYPVSNKYLTSYPQSKYTSKDYKPSGYKEYKQGDYSKQTTYKYDKPYKTDYKYDYKYVPEPKYKIDYKPYKDYNYNKPYTQGYNYGYNYNERWGYTPTTPKFFGGDFGGGSDGKGKGLDNILGNKKNPWADPTQLKKNLFGLDSSMIKKNKQRWI